MTIALDDFDLSILKQCPLAIDTSRKITTRMQAAKMKRIKRLWSAGLIRGTVGPDGKSLCLTIRDPGRIAIGRPALEASDAPAA